MEDGQKRSRVFLTVADADTLFGSWQLSQSSVSVGFPGERSWLRKTQTAEASPTIFERDDLPRSKGVCEMVIFKGFVVLRSIVMVMSCPCRFFVTFLWMVICDPFKGCL